MRLFILVICFLSNSISFANDGVVYSGGKITIDPDRFFHVISSTAEELCKDEFVECKHPSFQRIDFRDYVKYKQVKRQSVTDLVYTLDCKKDDKPTISYICHVKTKPKFENENIQVTVEKVLKIKME